VAETELLTKIQRDRQAYLGNAFEISLSSYRTRAQGRALPTHVVPQPSSSHLRGAWRTRLRTKGYSAGCNAPYHQPEHLLINFALGLKIIWENNFIRIKIKSDKTTSMFYKRAVLGPEKMQVGESHVVGLRIRVKLELEVSWPSNQC
jgi:hypothetical protein